VNQEVSHSDVPAVTAYTMAGIPSENARIRSDYDSEFRLKYFFYFVGICV
jgi:hypothetical protein